MENDEITQGPQKFSYCEALKYTCKNKNLWCYFQGSFDLVKSFVTRRNEHGGFLVIISKLAHINIDVVFALESMFSYNNGCSAL